MMSSSRRIRQVALRIVFALEARPCTTWEDVRAENERTGWTYETYSDETGLVRVEGDRLDIAELREAWALARQLRSGRSPQGTLG
jgi:hypothetical protein